MIYYNYCFLIQQEALNRTEYSRQNADIYTHMTGIQINFYSYYAYVCRQFSRILLSWIHPLLSSNMSVLPASPVTSSVIRTVNGRICVFPFVWRGQQYWSRTNAEFMKEWCATEVGHFGTPTAIGICQTESGMLYVFIYSS